MPRISLDMVTSGNTYDDSTNTLTAGSVDNCLTSSSGNNAQHSHPAHLMVQDVQDLVGWQARLNYDGGHMRHSTVNFTPFMDNNAGQNVSFLNQTLDGGVHRDLITAGNIPPQAAETQTALVGAVYNGAQGFAVSPDTPAKSPPDDGSYSAPSGGVLAAEPPGPRGAAGPAEPIRRYRRRRPERPRQQRCRVHGQRDHDDQSC